MGNLSLIDAIQLASSLGIMSGGFGVLRWAFTVERRLMKLEVKNEADERAAGRVRAE